MKNRIYSFPIIALITALIILTISSCDRKEDMLDLADFPATPEVFLDGFSGGLEYAAFGDSKLTAFEVVSDVSYAGLASLRFEIPNEGDPEGAYAGGILTDLGGRDLSGYNALTFWIKGSVSASVGAIGFGTDFIDDEFVAGINNLLISTSWTKVIIPIPDPSKLTKEKGLFLFSDGPDQGAGYTVWIDEVQFENLSNITLPRAAILDGEDETRQTFIGVNSTLTGLSFTANLPSGIDQSISLAPGYFIFNSSDSTIAKVNELGVISILSEGTAVITATLAGSAASGSLTLESIGNFTSAPVPTRDAADVISLFSDAYTNVPVDFYNGYYAPFQTTLGQNDINVNGDNIIKYTELNFVGSEFRNPTVNASEMTHLHLDVQVENALQPGDFIKIELADYGPDGAGGTGNESAGSVSITAPTLVSGQWVGLDIPFSDLAGLANRSSLWQLIFVTEGTNPNATGAITDLLVDNIYFYKDTGGGGGGGGDCSAETEQSLAANDFNLTFFEDPSASIGSFDAGLSTVDNPDSDNAVNTSCKVGQIDRVGSALFANNQIDFDAKFDFNANAGFKMKVWSATAGTNVLLKLEDKADSGVNTEIGAQTTVAGAWEELTFDFGAGESDKYDKIILFFELNTNTTATYYIDDFMLYSGGGGGGTCTAETVQSLAASDFNLTFFEDPSASIGSFDAGLSTIDNPDTDNAVNTSCKVGQIDRVGSALFANNQIDFDAKFDFNANAGFKMKVWSPNAGTNVLVKLEDKADSGVNTEIGAQTTAAGAWEELTFDFGPGESDKYDKIIFFFELNTNTTETYYIDDFMLYSGGGGGATCTAETAQSLAGSDFNLTFQMDPGAAVGSFDAALSTVDNPDFDNGVNNSCKVGQIDRNGSALFANNQIDFDSKFDFNANAGFKMKVWSAEAGTNVLVKLEDKANAAVNIEIGATTTMAGAWEELTFDFGPGESDKYDKIILFFQLNTNTTATYYIDDFMLYSGGGGGGGSAATFPLDFEDGALFFNAFEGATVGVIDNPQPTGNASSKVLELVKPNGVPFYAGINSDIALDGPVIDLANGLAFTVKVWSPKPGIKVRMRLEQEPGVTDPPAYEIFQTSTNANEWETLTFDFSTTAAQSSSSYTRMVLNTDWDTDPAGGETFYIDDIEQVAPPPPAAVLELPIDFDDAAVTYTFSTFNGASYSMVDNPELSGVNTVASKVGQITNSGANWEGGAFNLDNSVDFSTNKEITVKFYSTVAVPILMKFEGAGAPIETTANHGGTGWEQLTFTYTSSDQFGTLVIFVDGPGTTAGTFYMDDIEQVTAPPPAAVLELPIDFDDAAVTYTFSTFNGASYSMVDNPELSGVNTVASKVGQITNSGANWEGGAFNLVNPVDFSTNKEITMKFYSTVAVPILMKFEGAGAPIETTANHGGTGWEQLTFTFTSSDQFGTLVIFVDGPGTTAGTFYMDDIEQVASSGGGGGGGSNGNFISNGDFETGDDTGWLFFANNGTIAVTDTDNNGGTYSTKITSGPTNNPGIKQERFGAGTIIANQEIEIKFDVKAVTLVDGAIINVLAFSESSTQGVGAQLHNLGPITTASGNWESQTFTFTTGADVSGGISLLLEVVCGGAATCSGEAFFDNVSLTIK